MFGFFKKKSLHKKIKAIEGGLHYSFSKIKEDFLSTHAKIDRHHEHTSKRLDKIHIRLEQLERLFSSMQRREASVDQDISEYAIIPSQNPNLLYSLTEVQQRLFMELIALHLETGSEWISLKVLAKQLYPDKDYERVRSTLSEYTSILMEHGLLQKKIQRKKAYIQATKLGLVYLDKNRATKLSQIIKKKQKVN